MNVGIDARRRADELKALMAADFRTCMLAELDEITLRCRDVRGALASYASECLARMFDYSAALAADLIEENNAAIARQLTQAGVVLHD